MIACPFRLSRNIASAAISKQRSWFFLVVHWLSVFRTGKMIIAKVDKLSYDQHRIWCIQQTCFVWNFIAGFYTNTNQCVTMRPSHHVEIPFFFSPFQGQRQFSDSIVFQFEFFFVRNYGPSLLLQCTKYLWIYRLSECTQFGIHTNVIYNFAILIINKKMALYVNVHLTEIIWLLYLSFLFRWIFQIFCLYNRK